MCLDIGHANMHGSTHNDYIAYVDRLSPECRSSTPTCTRTTATATAIWCCSPARRRRTAGGDGADRPAGAARVRRSLILEQWPSPPEMLVTARDRLAEVIRAAG